MATVSLLMGTSLIYHTPVVGTRAIVGQLNKSVFTKKNCIVYLCSY